MTRTLAVDIGGTSIKAAVVDDGRLAGEVVSAPTPYPCPPALLVATVDGLRAQLPPCDRVGVGFPGVLRDGAVVWVNSLMRTVFNGPQDETMVRQWQGFDLATALVGALGLPVRMANDADVAALATVTGTGLECVVTLGTGLGFSLVDGGRLAPHLELSELPFHPGPTFEDTLGQRGLDAHGLDAWTASLGRAIAILRRVIGFDRLYLGGGNARLLHVDGDDTAFGPDVSLAPNVNGLIGAHVLWRD